MAKQSGIHGLRGKVNGMSYYGSKNGGALVRKINEGMSSRVKTAKEYANTRKNNAEFGMCGDVAGAIIKPFSLRWRFILDSIATGKMVKVLKEIVKLDNTGSWGERVIKSTYFDQIRAAFNSFSKNEMIQDVVSHLSLGVTYDVDNETLAMQAGDILSEATIQELIALGANYFYVKAFALKVSTPQYDANSLAYSQAVTSLTELGDFDNAADLTAGSTIHIFGATTTDSGTDPMDGANGLGALAVVFLPARKVGQSISILQQHCSAYMVPVIAAE